MCRTMARPHRSVRPAAAVGALLTVATFTAGCGSDETEADHPTTSPTSSATVQEPTEQPAEEPTEEPTEDEPEDAGTVIEVRIAGSEITPAGERVEVTAGEPITFEIDSDIPGEIHVHSNPEQYLEFEAGTSTLEITLDQPGVVEAELHEPETLLVQLEVR